MAMDREQAVRERAYALWVAGGRRPGTTDADWLRAEADVAAALAAVEPKRATGAGRRKAPTASQLDAAVGGGPKAAAGRPKVAGARPAASARPSRAARPDAAS